MSEEETEAAALFAAHKKCNPEVFEMLSIISNPTAAKGGGSDVRYR